MSDRKHIEIHMLQNVPVNSINLGGDGEIKTVGDRQRISSQAWKRPTRIALNDVFENKTIRTRVLNDQIGALDAPDENKSATKKLAGLLTKGSDSKTENDVMATFTTNEIDFFKRITIDGDVKKYLIDPIKFINDVKELNASFGVSLFGRMFANQQELNVSAAAKYAHSFSTHSIDIDDDYFTAVDDLNTNGAGHLGSKSFTSSVQYRYISIDYRQLLINQDQKIIDPDTMKSIIKTMILAFPTGKENNFFSRARPEYIRISVRNNNYTYTAAPAFEKPVSNSDGGFLENSINALEKYFSKTDRVYGDEYLAREIVPDSSLDEALERIVGVL